MYFYFRKKCQHDILLEIHYWSFISGGSNVTLITFSFSNQPLA